MNVQDKWPNVQDKGSVRGELRYRVYKGGRLIEEVIDHNVVVKGGRKRLAELVTGQTTNRINRIGFGTSSVAASENDTNLTNRQLFALKSASVSGTDAVFEWGLGINDMNGVQINELGLFTSDATPVMMTRQVRRSPLGKEDDLNIEGTYTLHFGGDT